MNEQSTGAAVPADQYVLTLSCPDKQGIVHAVSSYLFMTGCNIEDSQQFGDHDTGLFFMRVHFSADAPVTVEKLRASFAAIGDSFHMDWQIHRAEDRMRVLLMVSRFGHCLNDLLFRARIGALPVEITGVVSNHTDFAELVGCAVPAPRAYWRTNWSHALARSESSFSDKSRLALDWP